jgi:hypothetical protein
MIEFTGSDDASSGILGFPLYDWHEYIIGGN